MPAIEIQQIKKSVNIRVSGKIVVLPEPMRQKIDHHWQQLIKGNPRLHNGESFTVLTVYETDDAVDIELAETDYAHYLYSHQVGGLGEFTVRIIHSATLVITTDNTMIFGAMGDHTSRPGVIQCCGGGIDHNDITDDVVDIEHNTVKELDEELGINAYDKSLVSDFYPAYLKTGGPTGKMTLAYVLHLKQSSSQFLDCYQELVKKLEKGNQLPEFGQIFCLDMNPKTVNDFIRKTADKLNEYMPVLLRAAVNASSSGF